MSGRKQAAVETNFFKIASNKVNALYSPKIRSMAIIGHERAAWKSMTDPTAVGGVQYTNLDFSNATGSDQRRRASQGNFGVCAITLAVWVTRFA